MQLYNYLTDSTKEAKTIQNDAGTLTIAWHPDTENYIKNVLKDIKDRVESGDIESKLTPGEWDNETEKLIILAKDIMSQESGIRIFDYLPLTKAGRFQKNATILLCDSRCQIAASYQGAYGLYPSNQKIRLCLVPAYTSMADWLQDKPEADVMELRVGFYDAVKKKEPVFDKYGNPHKVDNKRASYIPDASVRPGFLYEEKSGTQYLCITGSMIKCIHHYVEANGRAWSGDLDNIVAPKDGFHTYIRWSDALEKRLKGDLSLENIISDMASRDDISKSLLESKLSRRENPRKFTKEVRQIYDPKTTGSRTIIGNKASYYGNGTLQIEYRISPITG